MNDELMNKLYLTVRKFGPYAEDPRTACEITNREIVNPHEGHRYGLTGAYLFTESYAVSKALDAGELAVWEVREWYLELSNLQRAYTYQFDIPWDFYHLQALVESGEVTGRFYEQRFKDGIDLEIGRVVMLEVARGYSNLTPSEWVKKYQNHEITYVSSTTERALSHLFATGNEFRRLLELAHNGGAVKNG